MVKSEGPYLSVDAVADVFFQGSIEEVTVDRCSVSEVESARGEHGGRLVDRIHQAGERCLS